MVPSIMASGHYSENIGWKVRVRFELLMVEGCRFVL